MGRMGSNLPINVRTAPGTRRALRQYLNGEADVDVRVHKNERARKELENLFLGSFHQLSTWHWSLGFITTDLSYTVTPTQG